MKIIAVSDIHGSYERTQRLLQTEQPWDGLIVAGDLTTHGSETEASAALDELLSFGSPVVAVCGNMDPRPLERVFAAKGVSVNGRGMTWGRVGIFGVSGSPPTPMDTPYEISESEIMARALRGWEEAGSSEVTIFVPHAPPHGTSLDRVRSGVQAGSTAVRSFIEEHRPTLVVCGHIHEARGTEMIGSTTVVNCGPAGAGFYAVIDVQNTVTVELKG